MSKKLPGLALQDETRLSDSEWIRISDDLQRVIRISDEEEWSAHAVLTLRELRIERFKLDNPGISEDEVISYFPVPDVDDLEMQASDSVLAKVVRDSVINSDQLPADLRESAKDLDARNADTRSKLIAEILISKNFRNLPRSFKNRIQRNPAFTLLSKQDMAQAGENEFDFSDREIEQKARLIAEAFYLRPPVDQETAMPAFGSSRTLFALPTIAPSNLESPFIAVKPSVVVIDVTRANCLITLESQTQFFSKLTFAFNLPRNRDAAQPDLPTPPQHQDQDELSPASWETWANSSELTSLLSRLELDKDDCKAKWFEIFRLLRSYKITPILMFSAATDFTMFRLALDLDFLSNGEKDIAFAAVVAGSWSERAISKWCRWANDKTAFDLSQPLHFEQLKEITSEAFGAGQSRYVSVVNVERSMMTVSNLPADFSLDTLVFGPWQREIIARRIWAPSPADMILTFDGSRPRTYPTVFFTTQNLHQTFLDQPEDPRAIEAALQDLANHDQSAAQFLEYVWSEAQLDYGANSPGAFRIFYNEVRLMLSDDFSHDSAPVPLSSGCPIPVFFRKGERLNNVLTGSPNFTQAFAWKPNTPISATNSSLPTLILRVLSLQSSLRSEGQIPVSITPSLELEIGLNPPTTLSVIDYDWKKWAEQERTKIRTFPIWKDFQNASKFLPLGKRIQLASHLGSLQLGFMGLHPAKRPDAYVMLETVWSPPVG